MRSEGQFGFGRATQQRHGLWSYGLMIRVKIPAPRGDGIYTNGERYFSISG